MSGKGNGNGNGNDGKTIASIICHNFPGYEIGNFTLWSIRKETLNRSHIQIHINVGLNLDPKTRDRRQETGDSRQTVKSQKTKRNEMI